MLPFLQTALLPICDDCLTRKLLPSEFGFPDTDTCLCATGISTYDCWSCAVGRLDFTMSIAKTKLTTFNDSGVEVVSCSCSKIMGQPEYARLCAGCGGIATLPAATLDGHLVGFHENDTNAVVIETVQPAQVKYEQETPTTKKFTPLRPASGSLQIRDEYDPGSARVQRLPRHHQVFSAAEVSQLRHHGLNIDGPITNTDVHAVTDPNLRLNTIIKSLPQPTVSLEPPATEGVLKVCGFRADEMVAIEKAMNSMLRKAIMACHLDMLVQYGLGGSNHNAATPTITVTEPMMDTEMGDV